jgi:hypothetical protein
MSSGRLRDYARIVRYFIGAWALLLGAAAFAMDDTDRAKLIGAWQSNAGGATWIFAQDGDTLHITHLQNDRKLADFACNTSGRECSVKEDGKSAKVSMWFNGPKLVVMETQGSEVVKRRFQPGGEGNVIEVETIPIVPEGKPETAKLNRAAAK